MLLAPGATDDKTMPRRDCVTRDGILGLWRSRGAGTGPEHSLPQVPKTG
jgi:hypothetical protein